MIKRFFKNHPIHKKIVPLFDLFFFMSPMSFFISSTIICIGMYLALFMENSNPLFLNNVNYHTVCLFFGIVCILFGNYINCSRDTNSIFSVPILKFNVKYSTVYKNNMVRFLYILGLLCLLNTNLIILSIGLMLIFLNIFIYKSYSDFIDSSPYISFLYQFLRDFLLLISGFVFMDRGFIYEFEFISSLIPYILLYTALFLERDSLAFILNKNLTNFGSLHSPFKITFISLGLLIIAFILAVLKNDPLCSIITIVSIPFYIYAFVRGSKKDFQRALVYPLGIINFFIITIFPYLFIPTFILFYLSKYYNWHRLDYHYPTFLVEDD
jgi:hypothetical protein